MITFDEITERKKPVGIIGLGYVGLPLALAFGKKFDVVGFDINESRISSLKKGVDPNGEHEKEEFEGQHIAFSSDIQDLKSVQLFIVTVPTPIDEHKSPDLTPLKKACASVGSILKPGDTVVFESTVYPGCTEEDCAKWLSQASGLNYPEDYHLGYSPERINPGDKLHTVDKIVKVVGANEDNTRDLLYKLYGSVITAGIHLTSSIKVAEASKIIENIQRDVNIALMNELSLIFNKMKINTYEVLEASGTKWNFLKFTPGLVGGHCIGVDPYYLTHKASEMGYHAKVILSGRTINDSMGQEIARRVMKHLTKMDKVLKQSRVLIMGTTFKENVTDIRNSKVVDIVNELKEFMINVDVVDPFADPDEVLKEYGYELAAEIGSGYDAVIVAVNHKPYIQLDEGYFNGILSDNGLLFDIKGIYRQGIKKLMYQSL